jgi:hypothetical protein
MEDALISPISFSILSGAGLIEATEAAPIFQHITEQTSAVTYTDEKVRIELEEVPAYWDEKLVVEENGQQVDKNVLKKNEDYIYVMTLDSNGDVNSEPFIAKYVGDGKTKIIEIVAAASDINVRPGGVDENGKELDAQYAATDLTVFNGVSAVLVDYYVARKSNAQQIEITADKFGGTYYLEASTLFRDAATGKDMPAEFIIPKCKIQSNFTFTMASSGDPSTFTFTMDAFPDYTRFDKTKKVLAAIQIMSESSDEEVLRRASTAAYHTHEADSNGIIVKKSAEGDTV